MGKIRSTPFLDAWKTFLDLLQRSDRTSAKFDDIIPPLLLTFESRTFKLPLRIETTEVLQLSGLEDQWKMTKH